MPVLQVPCAAALTVADNWGGGGGGLRVMWWFVVCIGVNGLYNHPLPRFSERPPLDLLLPLGYLGVRASTPQAAHPYQQRFQRIC